MKTHLITGGCGFVGRNMVKRFFNQTKDRIVFVDDLTVGTHPSTWLSEKSIRKNQNAEVFGEEERLIFVQTDAREIFRATDGGTRDYFKQLIDVEIDRFNYVFHFAAIVGGRATIDGDPIKVALDLSIDAEMFYWSTRHKPDHVLYPSSSAAYPVDLQTDKHAVALKESDIDFNNMGQPDMTYGWSKLTGEYLAKVTAQYYDIPVTCIRPFSGYGEDQDLTYPIPAIAARAARKENPFEVWGTGKQGRDFVHIDDVLDCTLAAMDKIKDGTAINIGQGKLTSFLDIIEIFTDFAGYKPEIKCLLDKPVGVHSRYCNMDYVKEVVGWEPKISIREGMRRVYEEALKKNS